MESREGESFGKDVNVQAPLVKNRSSYSYYMKQKQREQQENILLNISKYGIGASEKEFRLRSYDEKKNKVSFLYLVDIDKKRSANLNPILSFFQPIFENSESVFSPLVHDEIVGLWSITLERQNKVFDTSLDVNPDYLEWEDRLNSNILFILNSSESLLEQSVPSSFDPLIGDRTYSEYTTYQGISSNHFSAILCPDELLAICKKVFGHTLNVYSVKQCMKSTRIPEVGSEFDWRPEHLIGPDYAKGLDNLVKERKIPRNFFCHLVRLPSKRDLVRIPYYSSQLLASDCLQSYNTSDPNIALRRICAESNHREDIEYLLHANKEQISINSKSATGGNTPLHHAILYYAKERKDCSIIKLLLSRNANCRLKNDRERDALMLARENNVDVEAIKSGEEDKKFFKERVKQNFTDSSFPNEVVGRAYKPIPYRMGRK